MSGSLCIRSHLARRLIFIWCALLAFYTLVYRRSSNNSAKKRQFLLPRLAQLIKPPLIVRLFYLTRPWSRAMEHIRAQGGRKTQKTGTALEILLRASAFSGTIIRNFPSYLRKRKNVIIFVNIPKFTSHWATPRR